MLYMKRICQDKIRTSKRIKQDSTSLTDILLARNNQYKQVD